MHMAFLRHSYGTDYTDTNYCTVSQLKEHGTNELAPWYDHRMRMKRMCTVKEGLKEREMEQQTTLEFLVF